MKIVDKRNSLRKHTNKSYRTRAKSSITNIAIHHSATTSGSAEAFANYHVNTLSWPGIGYHYVIDKNGTIYQCHDLEVISYHVGNHNSRAVGICMIGNFVVESPTDAQMKAAIELTTYLLTQLKLSVHNVFGHNEFSGHASTLCPAIDMNQFRKRLLSTNQDLDIKLERSPSYVVGKIRPYLSQGDQGDDVLQLQKSLKKLGFDPIYLDGIFGPATYRALIRFQRYAQISVDGIAGPETWEALKNSKGLKGIVDDASPLDESTEKEEKSASSSRRILRYIQPMMRGNDVLQVQQKTNATPDGVFGPLTEQAVKHFQWRNNLIVDGIVGPVTWAALDRVKEADGYVYKRLLKLQSPYMQGEDVKQVQRVLNVAVDGYYGPVTEQAVRNFQKKAGLAVDGIVGPKTWEKLFKKN